MKSKKAQKNDTKFSLEKFEVAKLKNLRMIVGGGDDKKDDPIDTNHHKNDNGGSSVNCK